MLIKALVTIIEGNVVMDNEKLVKKKSVTKSNSKALNDLEKLVGHEVYATWIKMLKDLVPHGRTHRLAVVVAGMLQYAYEQCHLKHNLDNPVAAILEEVYDNNEVNDECILVVKSLFKNAGVKHERKNRRGEKYCIIEASLQEFLYWENMPWE